MEIKCNFLYFQVIHFLLCKLDKEKSETLFRDCWPIFDKKMEAEFRRVCFNWYKELQVSLNIMRGSISVKFTFFVLEKKNPIFSKIRPVESWICDWLDISCPNQSDRRAGLLISHLVLIPCDFIFLFSDSRWNIQMSYQP